MASIQLDDIVFLGVVSLIASFQLAIFAKLVGKARMKYKINPPVVTGDPNFDRVFRAQQNCLEFYPIFITIFWMAGLFFNQYAAVVLGLYYVYSRQQYFHGYSADAKDRVPAFKSSVKALQLLLVITVLGLANVLLLKYAGVNVKKEALKYYYGK